jgi:hypothetical protein
MTVKQYIGAAVTESAKNFLTQLKKLPADQLDFQPSATSRTALDMAQECAFCPLWSIELTDKALGDAAPVRNIPTYEDRVSRVTVADLEAALSENLAHYHAALEAFPEDKLDEEFMTGWGKFTGASAFGVPHWNLDYHTGQICYIQLMHGDTTS